jgi:hypothetical protein
MKPAKSAVAKPREKLPAFSPSNQERAGMYSPRSRRLIRIAMLSTAVTLLLASGYFSSYFGMCWLADRGIVSGSTSQWLQATVYLPVSRYMGSSVAGSETARRFTTWVHSASSGKPAAWIPSMEKSSSEDIQISRLAHPVLLIKQAIADLD